MGYYSKQEMQRKARGFYLEYNEHVKKTMPKEKLLVFRLGKGWGPLCESLGKEVPDVPFPHLHSGELFAEKMGMVVKEAVSNMLKTAALVIVPVAGAALSWMYYSPR